MTILSLTEAELRRRTSLKWCTYAPDVLPLWVAEMDTAMHPAVRAALDEAMDAGDTGYPHGTGYADAFTDLATDRWGWTPASAEVKAVGDVMNAILTVLLAVTEKGDRVVINPPIYPPFRAVTDGYGRPALEVPLTDDGRLDLDGLEAAFTGPERPKAYLLCSPHNPTGTVHTADELRAVADLCRRHDVWLIVDEIHNVLVDAGTPFVPLLSLPEASRAVMATSAGKGWNLAAFKAGLLVRGAEASEVFENLPPLAQGSHGQFGKIAHTAAMRHAQDWVDELMTEVTDNKRLLAELLAEHAPGVRYEPTPGTYLAWLDCSALGLADPQATFVRRGKVAFNPGRAFGADYEQFVRVNLACSPELLQDAVERLAASL